MASKKKIPEKAQTMNVETDTVKGLNIVLDSLKKSGYAADSKEIKAIQELIDKQK